jgi:microcystin-dependent protein
MAENYIKNLLGFEDIFFDTKGVGSSYNRKISTGDAMSIKGLNSSQIPLLLTTRTLALYDQGVLDAEEVDGALTQICTSLASIHKFQNEEILDAIQSAGSGAVISSDERAKLNRILDTGSGQIITVAERNKLGALVGLTQAQIDQITDIGNIMPVGAVIGFPTNVVPSGFFECNGAAVSRSTYSNLYALLGSKYGDGDGSLTFNLPDYRGEFLRGWDHGAGNDPDSSTRTDRGDLTIGDNVGTKQASEFGSHHHTLVDLEHFSTQDVTTNNPINSLSGAPNDSVNQFPSAIGLARQFLEEEGGAETRPRNVGVQYCIRWLG